MSNNDVYKTYYEKVPQRDICDDKNSIPVFKYGFGIRHVQAFVLFICLTISFVARVHLGITIVAMTNVPPSVNITDTFGNNSTANYQNEESDSIYRTYGWSKPVQEMIMNAFLPGYFLMMFPIGMVCQRWGGKLPLQICLLINGLVSIPTPWLAVWGGWKAVAFCRFMQGLSQAGLLPGIHTQLAKWVPLEERGRLSTFVYTGCTTGTILAFQLGGVLSDCYGWPATYWMTGALCLAAFALLTIWGVESPSEHQSISQDEKNFILGFIDDGIRKKYKTPWKKILTSKHVWAALIAHAGSGVVIAFTFTEVPTYVHYVLKANVKDSGLLASLPSIADFILCMCFGALSDYFINRKLLKIQNARRICNSIAEYTVTLCMSLVSFTTSIPLAMLCFITSTGAHTAIHSGWMINYIDLAPNYSGFLMAAGNTLMNVFMVGVPVFVSYIVVDVTDQYQWRITFFLVAAIAFICNTIFLIFMSSDTQAWNEDGYKTTDLEEHKSDYGAKCVEYQQ